MTTRLNPYISFNGNAREAMEFYHSIFGGDLTVSTFGDFGAPDAAIADKVMHSSLVNDEGFALMGSDTPPGMAYTPGGAITISLSGEDTGLRDYWQKLAEGGTVTMPMEKQVWGDEFGQCIDKFGVGWMVNIVQAQVA